MDFFLPILATGIASLIIGALVGATGVGGFFIIPIFAVVLDLPLRTAMGTALVAGAVNGALGAWLFWRRGNMDWSVALPLMAGSALFALAGGWINQWLPLNWVAGALGLVMVIGNAAVFRKHLLPRTPFLSAYPFARVASLLSIGSASGGVAGITGAGGPLVSVPLMTICAYPVLTTVGAGQMLALVAGTSGSVAYWANNHVSWLGLAASVPLQLVGIKIGVWAAHRISGKLAARIVAASGIVAGVAILGLILYGLPL